MKYLDVKKRPAPGAKAMRGAPENKALGGAPENKGDDVPAETEGTDALAGVSFAAPAAKRKAEEAGLAADAFKRKRKSSDRGFTTADVERIAAAAEAEED